MDMGMNERNIQSWRVQRLQAMVEREGGKSALGRKLGYRDGAFVGQMLRGERPISEKTVFAVHKLPGYGGWFDIAKADNLPAVTESNNVELSGAPSTSIPQSLETVAVALQQSDDITLDQVKLLFARLTDAPARAPEIVPRIAALLTTNNDPPMMA